MLYFYVFMSSVKSSRKTTTVITSVATKNLVFKYQIDKVYRTIKQVAVACNAVYQPRKGFMYLKSRGRSRDSAIWCIKLNDSSIAWENNMDTTGNLITEKRRKDKTVVDFKKRVLIGAKYDPELYRLTFVKEARGYRFVGVFKAIEYDFKNMYVMFEKVRIPQVVVKTITKKVVTIIVEESVEIDLK